MKKNVLVRIIFITLIFITIFSLSNINMAFDPEYYEPDELHKKDSSVVFYMGEELLGLLRNMAAVTAILTIAVIGVKYIYASAEQKAEYKATLVPWFFGAILVIMVMGLLGIIQELATKI